MADKIRLVRGDTRPQLKTVIIDDATKSVLSLVGATAVMKFRRAGTKVVQSTLTGVLLPGLEMLDGSLNSTPPYNVPGSGGRVVFAWSPGQLDTQPGDYEGEISLTFSDLTTQTVYDPIQFKLKDKF